MEQECLLYFQRIEELGGVLPAIKEGFFQSEIAEASARYQRETETGDRIIVGVNAYELEEDIEIPILRMDPQGEDRHLERLQNVRATRDQARAAKAMRELEEASRGNKNVMPYLIEAAHAYC